VRAAFGWTGRHVVLTVGALQARKGQDAMIRALPLIRRDCPSVLYVIAGEGWQKPYLEELVTTHRVTDFVQFRDAPSDDEVLALYQQCDLFVLPNRQVGWDFEGFGIVLLEAQACGRAVIAGRSGGAPEAIDAGRTGELVDGESVDELARVVVSLLTDDARREALGRAGREWATTHFDWRVAAARAKALFARYAGSRPPAKPNESLE
jgi:phosphatidylinositol alpha-1,6-mannosyltransferase